jgi:RNA polymerase sigma-70 factor (ECF subfamily)
MERLCRIYWPPLYAYLRRQRHSVEDAQDLTQEFFARLLERGSLRDVRRNKGRFRSFLLASMNHCLADEWDRAHRQKRGGGSQIIPLDALGAEERYCFEPVERLDAARLFNRRWAMTVLEQAIARLEAELADRPAIFAELQSFLVGDTAGRTCAEAAAKLSMTEVAVRATVSRMRKRCRELVREEIGRTVASLSEVEDEYRALLEALRS